MVSLGTVPREVLDRFYEDSDPLPVAVKGLTEVQRSAYESDCWLILLEGGNQSGKTWTACVDFVSFLLGRHRLFRGLRGVDRQAWYATYNYEMFGEQAWGHIKRLLLYPGESEFSLPTKRIRHIVWETHGKVPSSVQLTSGAGFTVKTYKQGRDAFQAKTLRYGVVDEECDDDVWEEILSRMLSVKGRARLVIPVTPVKGKLWLDELRNDAGKKYPGLFHVRLKTLDNPTMNADMVSILMRKLKNDPDRLKLRLEGIPCYNQGLIYPDGSIWRGELHEVDPFKIPRTWTRYRCIDPGWKNCACLWVAVSPPDVNTVVVYRDYLAHECTIAQNAARIRSYEDGGEYCQFSYIDPAANATDAETGEKLIDRWRANGVLCQPAPDNVVLTGIERVRDLMIERGGIDRDRMRLRVFRTCEHFLRERRQYRWPDERKKGDEGKEKPLKRDDHVMDCFRYIVAGGLEYVEPRLRRPRPDPETNPIGYAFWVSRNMSPDTGWL